MAGCNGYRETRHISIQYNRSHSCVGAEEAAVEGGRQARRTDPRTVPGQGSTASRCVPNLGAAPRESGHSRRGMLNYCVFLTLFHFILTS